MRACSCGECSRSLLALARRGTKYHPECARRIQNARRQWDIDDAEIERRFQDAKRQARRSA